MIGRLITLANYLDLHGHNKEADSLDILIKESLALTAPILTGLLGACSPENQIIQIKDESAEGDTGLDSDTGADTGGELSWNDLPSCTQKVDWLPHPSDPLWNEGVPIEDFYIVGRDETLPAEEVGEYIFSVLDSDEKNLLCKWDYVPDSCDYWTSEFNVWTTEGEDDLSGMDQVYEAYEDSPLLTVTCNFPVEERSGKKFLKLPLIGTGGSIGRHDLNDDCVIEYLEAIGEEIDTGI